MRRADNHKSHRRRRYTLMLELNQQNKFWTAGVEDGVSGVLSREAIRELIDGQQRLVSGLIDVDSQLQPCGLDVTLGAVFEFTEAGRLGQEERHLPDRMPLPFDFWGWLHLAPGNYMVQLN